MERLSQAAALCSEVTVILAALALLVKPLRDKLLGLDKLTDALKCQLRHDMLHTYYRHREDRPSDSTRWRISSSFTEAIKPSAATALSTASSRRSTSGRW